MTRKERILAGLLTISVGLASFSPTLILADGVEKLNNTMYVDTEIEVENVVNILDSKSYEKESYEHNNLLDLNEGEYEDAGFIFTVKYDESAKIIKYVGDEKSNLHISDVVDYGGQDIKVSEIGNNAFYDVGLEGEITLPRELSIIGDYAFSCNNITSINSYDLIEEIGSSAFLNNKIEKIILADSDEDYEINLGDQIKKIGSHAFQNNALTGTLNVPDSLGSLEPNVFAINNIREVLFGEEVKSIGEDAFFNNDIEMVLNKYNSSNRKNFKVADSLEHIGRRAFADNNISGLIDLPLNLHSLGEYAFSENEIKGIGQWPNNKKFEFGRYSFFINDIESLELPEGIEVVPEGAFHENKINNLTLPNSVKIIEDIAFYSNRIENNDFLVVGVEVIGNESFSSNEIKGEIILPEGLKEIGEATFISNKIDKVVTPKSLQKMGSKAFDNSVSMFINNDFQCPKIKSRYIEFGKDVDDVFGIKSIEAESIVAYNKTIKLPEILKVRKLVSFRDKFIVNENINEVLNFVEIDKSANVDKNEYSDRIIVNNSKNIVEFNAKFSVNEKEDFRGIVDREIGIEVENDLGEYFDISDIRLTYKDGKELEYKLVDNKLVTKLPKNIFLGKDNEIELKVIGSYRVEDMPEELFKDNMYTFYNITKAHIISTDGDKENTDEVIESNPIKVTICRVMGASGKEDEEIVLEDEDVLVLPNLVITLDDEEKEINKDEVAILDMVSKEGYLKGYPDKTIRPESEITREEVAMVVYRLLDSKNIYTKDDKFIDLKMNWSKEAINVVSELGIMTGYSDGSFKPGNSITRGEMATVVSRFTNIGKEIEVPFSDISNNWSEKAIKKVYTQGWIQGYKDGSFRPDNKITRAEFASIMNKVLKRDLSENNIESSRNSYKDLDKNKWYYLDILEATNINDYLLNDDNTEEWIRIK